MNTAAAEEVLDALAELRALIAECKDWLAGLRGLELRNDGPKYRFEMSRGFPAIQPKLGREGLSEVSDDMRELVEEEWPQLVHKWPPKILVRFDLSLDADKDRADNCSPNCC